MLLTDRQTGKATDNDENTIFAMAEVTIESGLTTLELHITTVPVGHQVNNATYYEESTQCNEIMVCVDIKQAH